MMKRALHIAILLMACTQIAHGATIFATTCNSSDVQAAINSSAAGGTVQVPSGTCSWSSGISFSGISVIGAGKGTSGTVITAGTATITKHATQLTRLSGFRFTGTDVHAIVSGSPSARSYIIDNTYFNSGGSDFFDLNANGGLLYSNDFFMPPSQAGGPDVMMIHPNETWSQATTFGMDDTQGPLGGERNIYFEDNTFTNVLETAPDGDQGARLVIRHNTYTDSSIVFHSGAPNDTSTDGTRQYEVYSNSFKRVNINNNVNKWIWSRGGSGVIANNVMDIVSTSQFGNKIQVRLGIGCPVPYPVPHQQGQTSATPQSPPPQPLLIFGNTGAGATGASFMAIAGNDTGTGSGTGCSNPGAFVQVGRDYMTSNTWGWTPFTYPHPLRGATPPPPPPPPPTAPVISGSLPAGTVGQPYSGGLSASGGTPPYTWAVTPTLPAGLSVNPSTGAITGTPSTTASAQETFMVVDSMGTPSASVTSTLTINAASTFTPVRIKAGVTFRDSQGNTWSPDTAFCTGGSIAARTHAITGALPAASDGALYQTERYNNPTCRISAPTGTYTATIKFADSFFSTTGSRLFNVTINGVTVLSNFDVVAAAGGEWKAIDKTFSVTSTGTITIAFVNVKDNAIYDAIQIVASGGPPPPPPPQPSLTESCVNSGASRVCTFTPSNIPSGTPITVTGNAGGATATNTGNLP